MVLGDFEMVLNDFEVVWSGLGWFWVGELQGTNPKDPKKGKENLLQIYL